MLSLVARWSAAYHFWEIPEGVYHNITSGVRELMGQASKEVDSTFLRKRTVVVHFPRSVLLYVSLIVWLKCTTPTSKKNYVVGDELCRGSSHTIHCMSWVPTLLNLAAWTSTTQCL